MSAQARELAAIVEDPDRPAGADARERPPVAMRANELYALFESPQPVSRPGDFWVFVDLCGQTHERLSKG